MRASGNIPNRDIRHLTPEQRSAHLTNHQKALYEKHGPGVMNAVPNTSDDSIDWTYDYAQRVTGEELQRGELDEDDLRQMPNFVHSELFAVLARASTFLKNATGVKQVPDGTSPTGSKYVLLNEDDEDTSAQERCDVINYLDSFVAAGEDASRGRDFSGFVEVPEEELDENERAKALAPNADPDEGHRVNGDLREDEAHRTDQRQLSEQA